MANADIEKAEYRTPHSIEAERAIIGCLLQNNDIVDEVFSNINYEMFYNTVYRALFKSIGELRDFGVSADKVTLKDQVTPKAKKVSEKINDMRNKVKEEGFDIDKLDDEFFAEIIRETPITTNYLQYCSIIKEKYMLRTAIEYAGNIIEECRAGEKSAELICSEAQDNYFKLGTNNADKAYVRADDLISPIFDRIAKASKTPDGITGIRTGYTYLDSMTAGLQRSDMIVLAGRPGMGKTTFALNLAFNIAKNNQSVLFFSLEMNDIQLVQRVLASTSGVSSSLMKTGKLGDNYLSDLVEGARQIHNKKLFIIDNTFVTISELRNKCMKVKTKEGLDTVFIDYLQLMHAGTNYRNSQNSKNGFMSRQEEVAEISRNIKALAKELDVPIIALSQLSRDAEKSKPQLSDLRESGAIEQDADIVMLLDKGRDNEQERDDNINVNIAKHRSGSTGNLSFKFDKSTTRFIEWNNKDE